MGQHDRMRLGVRQVEAAAEGVAELVVQRHANRAQHRAAEPGAVERLARAPRVPWFATIRGSASFSARMPSTAIIDDIGLRSCA